MSEKNVEESSILTNKKFMHPKKPAITPSILSADFINLGQQLEILAKNGVRILHLDIMDGHFVPNISYGPGIVKQISKHFPFFLEAHLMISDPYEYIPSFKAAGVKAFSVHVEIEPDFEKLRSIAGEDIPIGIAINPLTPKEILLPYLEIADWFLVMSVQAGFGGQDFNPIAIETINWLRDQLVKIRDSGKITRFRLIQIDGGINLENIGIVKKAGVNYFVVGSAFFKAPSIEEYLKNLYIEIK